MFWLFFLLGCTKPIESTEDVLDDSELQLLYTLEKHPSTAKNICSQLKESSNQSYCKNISQRPHLWEKIKNIPFTQRKGGGPNAIHVTLKNISSPKLRLIEASTIPCASNLTKRQCHLYRAQKQSKLIDIAAECNALTAKAKSECYFLAAEAKIKNPSVSLSDAFDLCHETGSLWSSCIQHITTQLARNTPPASSNFERWTSILQYHDELRLYWDKKHAVYTPIVLDYFWEEVMILAFSYKTIPYGDIFDFLPPESHPHIRTHLTNQLIKNNKNQSLTLEQWTQYILAHLHKRSSDKTPIYLPKENVTTVAQTQRKHINPAFRKWDGIDKNWSHDYEVDDVYPAVYFFKDSRRAMSINEEEDIQISILETTARIFDNRSLLEEGLQSSSELIQFTAYRLLKK